MEPTSSYERLSWIATTSSSEIDSLTNFAEGFNGIQSLWLETLGVIINNRIRPKRAPVAYLSEVVGKGAQFEVWRARVPHGSYQTSYYRPHTKGLEPGSAIALKRIICQRDTRGIIQLGNQERLGAILREIQALSRPSLREHENIAKLLNVIWEERSDRSALWPTLIMSYYPLSLAQVQARTARTLSYSAKSTLLDGIASGLSALHIESFCHGDIKSENVLIDLAREGKFIPKLADFGSCIQIGNSGSVNVAGTLLWRAPECSQAVTVELLPLIDLYSFGLLIWRVFIDGANPFEQPAVKEMWLSLSPERMEGIFLLKSSEDLSTLAANDVLDASDARPKHSSNDPWIDILRILITPSPVERLARIRATISPSGQTLAEHISSSERLLHQRSKPPQNSSKALKFQALMMLQAQIPRSLKMTVDSLVRMAAVDRSRDPGAAIKRQIFTEILEHIQIWRRYGKRICGGCCAMTSLDTNIASSMTDAVETIREVLKNGELTNKHTCNIIDPEWQIDIPASANMPGNLIFIPMLNLICCYVEGYGVACDTTAAVEVLLEGAQCGMISYMSLASRFLRYFDLPSPKNLPIKTWLVRAIVLADSFVAHRELQILDEKAWKAAQIVRKGFFNGLELSIDNYDWPFHEEDEEQTLGNFRHQNDVVSGTEERFTSRTYPNLNEDISQRENQGTSSKSKEKRRFERVIQFLNGHHLPMDKDGDLVRDNDGNTVLHSTCGCFHSSPRDLSYMLESCGEMLNMQNSRGETPLYLSCRANKIDSARYLLSIGADPCLRTFTAAVSPLHWAARHGQSTTLISELINKGANPNALCSDLDFQVMDATLAIAYRNDGVGFMGSPLHWAIVYSRVEVISALLANGGDPNMKLEDSPTPLQIAVTARNYEVLRLIFSHLDRMQVDFGSLFSKIWTDPTSYQALLHGYTTIDEQRTVEVLFEYCYANSKEDIVEILGFTADSIANACNLDRLKHLLDVGKKWIRRWTVENIQNAKAEDIYLEILNSSNLFRVAVGKEDCAFLEYLLSEGMDVSIHDPNNRTPLHLVAFSNGNVKIAHILLRNGVNIDVVNLDALTAYQEALLAGNCDVARAIEDSMNTSQLQRSLIVEHANYPQPINLSTHLILVGGLLDPTASGLNYLIRNRPQAVSFLPGTPSGESVLHIAVGSFDFNEGDYCESGPLASLRVLLQQFKEQEQLNFRDKAGFAPLHAAVCMGRFQETQLLIEAGAQINLKTSAGYRALDLAYSNLPEHTIPPRYVPTRQMMLRWCQSRNALTSYLRSQGAIHTTNLTFQFTFAAIEQQIPFPDADIVANELVGNFEARQRVVD